MKSNTFSLRSCAAVGILAGVFAAPTAFADELFRPYVGVGAQVLKLELEKAYGGPLFNKGVIPGSTVFAGVRFGDFLGAELGYNYFSRKREAMLGINDIFPGTGQPLGNFGPDWTRYRTRVLIKDVNLGVTGYLPLETIGCMFSKTEVFGTVGVSRASVKMHLQVLALSDGSTPSGAIDTFTKKKTIPLARVGLQQNITENINLSLFSEWKHLSGFKMKTQRAGSLLELRLKDSVSYGLRLGYIF